MSSLPAQPQSPSVSNKPSGSRSDIKPKGRRKNYIRIEEAEEKRRKAELAERVSRLKQKEEEI